MLRTSNSPAAADGAEGLIGLVGQLDTLDGPGADWEIPAASWGVADQVQVLVPEADELVDEGHRLALGGEAAKGRGGPVRGQGRRLGQADELGGHGAHLACGRPCAEGQVGGQGSCAFTRETGRPQLWRCNRQVLDGPWWLCDDYTGVVCRCSRGRRT